MCGHVIAERRPEVAQTAPASDPVFPLHTNARTVSVADGQLSTCLRHLICLRKWCRDRVDCFFKPDCNRDFQSSGSGRGGRNDKRRHIELSDVSGGD